MPKCFKSVFRQFFPLVVSFLSIGLFSAEAYSQNKPKFDSSVRVGYVPHPSLTIENGLTSGSLADLIECSTAYFSHIEFVEMPAYSFMERALESNVIDIGLNMAKTGKRDEVGQYAFDLYKSRILLVGNDKSSNNKGAGVLGVKQGSEIDTLLLAKGYQVNTKAYSLDRLIEMYRTGLINSFAESEVSVYDDLTKMDEEQVDYDYKVLAEYAGGAYFSKYFLENYPKVQKEWKDVSSSCAYLAPKLEL